MFSTGFDTASAVAILDDAEAFLSSTWNLQIGADSRMVLPAHGAEQSLPTDSPWPVVSSMRCLGHILSSNGTIANDFDDTVRKMWGCFYGNLQPGLRKASPQARMRFLNSCVRSVASFRWSRWPFQSSYADRLNGVHSQMVSQLFPVEKLSHEDALSFFLRRARVCRNIAAASGRWSERWQASLAMTG